MYTLNAPLPTKKIKSAPSVASVAESKGRHALQLCSVHHTLYNNQSISFVEQIRCLCHNIPNGLLKVLTDFYISSLREILRVSLNSTCQTAILLCPRGPQFSLSLFLPRVSSRWTLPPALRRSTSRTCRSMGDFRSNTIKYLHSQIFCLRFGYFC